MSGKGLFNEASVIGVLCLIEAYIVGTHLNYHNRLIKAYVVGTHLNCLDKLPQLVEAIQKSTRNKCFYKRTR